MALYSSNIGLIWNVHYKISLSFFYIANWGSHYSFIYNTSPNVFNNKSKASLIYIPRDKGDINMREVIRKSQVVYSADVQWCDLNALIE
ncbi:MAG: hypothetical protein ABI045_02500 [Flavobacteriales bacterium]